MVFSSLPIFLDPPNWTQIQQQPLQCLIGGGGGQGLHGYHFADGDGGVQLVDGFPRGVASGLLAQLASVKMEEHGTNNGGGGGGGVGFVGAHEQYWPGNGGGGGGGGGWPVEFLSGFSSSSSGNVL
uniref:Uncharacterized protein n=1 Tax=Oryza punctata TaxID=4537 RepID=A0A0E0MNS5_ORYPU